MEYGKLLPLQFDTNRHSFLFLGCRLTHVCSFPLAHRLCCCDVVQRILQEEGACGRESRRRGARHSAQGGISHLSGLAMHEGILGFCLDLALSSSFLVHSQFCRTLACSKLAAGNALHRILVGASTAQAPARPITRPSTCMAEKVETFYKYGELRSTEYSSAAKKRKARCTSHRIGTFQVDKEGESFVKYGVKRQVRCVRCIGSGLCILLCASSRSSQSTSIVTLLRVTCARSDIKGQR